MKVGEKAASLPQLLADVHRVAEGLVPGGDHDDVDGDDDNDKDDDENYGDDNGESDGNSSQMSIVSLNVWYLVRITMMIMTLDDGD